MEPVEDEWEVLAFLSHFVFLSASAEKTPTDLSTTPL